MPALARADIAARDVFDIAEHVVGASTRSISSCPRRRRTRCSSPPGGRSNAARGGWSGSRRRSTSAHGRPVPRAGGGGGRRACRVLVDRCDAAAIAAEAEQLRARWSPVELAEPRRRVRRRDRRARRSPTSRSAAASDVDVVARRVLRARRPPAARLAPRPHRRAAPRRPLADRSARRTPRRPARPAPRAHRGRARDDRRQLPTVGTRRRVVAAHATRSQRYRAVLIRHRGRRRVRPHHARRGAPEPCASCASSAALSRPADARARDAIGAERGAGGVRRRTRRGRHRRGAPRPTRGTGRGPASRRARAREPAGTRAAATNAIVPPPSAPPDEVGVAGFERGRRQQVARGDQRAEPGRVFLDLGFHPVGEDLGVAVGPLAAQSSPPASPRGSCGTWV